MYIVLVTHNTGDGPSTDLVQFTDNLKEALDTARKATPDGTSEGPMGFQFYDGDCCACIVDALKYVIYKKRESEYVFVRRPKWEDGKVTDPLKWKEEWYKEY